MKGLSLFLTLSLLVLQTSAFTLSPKVADKKTMIQKCYKRSSQALNLLPMGYSFCLANYHLATESVTAGVMAGLGDAIAQKKFANDNPDKQMKYKPARSFHFYLKGLIEGVAWSFWYKAMEPLSISLAHAALKVLGRATGSPLEQVLKTFFSIFFDYVVASPLIFGLLDIPIPSLLAGKPPRKVIREVKEKLPELLWSSYIVWTPVNIVIYNIPLQYRVILQSFTDVFWQSVVSAISTRESPVEIAIAPVEQEIIQMIPNAQSNNTFASGKVVPQPVPV